MKRVLVGLAVLLGACQTVTSPDALPDGMTPVGTPLPAVYAETWARVEACSGLAGEFSRVTYLDSPGTLTIPRYGTFGETLIGQHAILLSGILAANIAKGDSAAILTLAHEDIHELTQRVDADTVFVAVLKRCDGVARQP